MFKNLSRSFFYAESESATRFSKFGFSHPLEVTKSQKKNPKKNQNGIFMVFDRVENDYECQKQKKPIFNPIPVLPVLK